MGQDLYLCPKVKTMIPTFKSLSELFDRFPTQESCVKYLEQSRWGNTPTCPHCGCEGAYKTNRGYKCKQKECSKKFTVTVGTFFESTKIPLRQWFAALYLVSCTSKGVSSVQLSKDLNVTQKTAWFMLHRIREMLRDKHPVYLTGDVEADETWIGGKEGNKHKDKQTKPHDPEKSHFDAKTPVIGILQRGGYIVVKKVDSVSYKSLTPVVVNTVSTSARVFTDEGGGYSQLRKIYKSHQTVTHSLGEYANGEIHCNGVENFWSLFKRGINGIYHQVSRKHLNNYCNEYAFRFNYRKDHNALKFWRVLNQCKGRLMYKDLIAQ